MQIIPIESMNDVAAQFAGHSYIGPLLRDWFEVHRNYSHDPSPPGDREKVLDRKEQCLEAVARCGSTVTFDVTKAKARKLHEEKFPPAEVWNTVAA